jgi:hypothetical protein
MKQKMLFKATTFTVALMILSGCAGEKVLFKTYAPPLKQKEVENMKSAAAATSGYLDLEVVSKVMKDKGVSTDKSFDSKLVANLKKFITQTNFISISDVAGISSLSLDMKVLNYKYEQSANTINGQIAVEFNIRKESEIFYTQDYKYEIKRFSRAGAQGLPSKDEILSEASKYLAKKLIKDISPISTQKLVELKSLPKEIEYTINYVKSSNYEGAIKGMLKYQGEKTAEYCFDLAIYYEGLASQSDNIELLAKADEYYNKAMELSKGGDEVITNGKSKFDNYYKIIKQVAEQKLKNAKNQTSSQFDIL